MSSLMTKIALHKGIGVCLSEHEITICKLAFTLRGPVEIASASASYGPDTLSAELKKLLAPLLGRRRHIPVAIGLPCSKLFIGTRPASGNSKPTVAGMLEKTLCSPTLDIDELAADMLLNIGSKTPSASVVACRKKYMVGIVSALKDLGVRPVRVEPSPCSLVRTAMAHRKYPHRAKTVLCVFLGDDQGVAAVVSGGRPLAWKAFALPRGGEGAAILSAIRTLETQGKNYGLEWSLEYAAIHGRPDLHERMQEEQLPTKINVRVIWQEGPALAGTAIAFGTAAGCLDRDAKTFDLSRHIKSRPSIMDIFPWWDFSYATLLVVWLALSLYTHSVKLEEEYLAVQMQSSNHKCLCLGDLKNLAKDTEDLEDRVEVVYDYLDSRIQWTEHMGDIIRRLPREVGLGSFKGEWIMQTGGRRGKRARKSMLLKATAPQSADDAAPLAIDDFLNELRNDPFLKKKFGLVELTDISRSLSRDKKTSVAAFTLLCLPDKKKGSSK